MKRFFLILLTYLLLCINSYATENCPDNMKINGLDHTVKSYADFWGNYYKPHEAYDFGIKIQNIIKEKDLAGLFKLAEGELKSGPRKSFIKDKNFDEIFNEEWVNSILSKNIRKLRAFKNLNQTQFAELIEVKRASIGAYEEGRAEPKLDTLIRITSHFKITLDNLIVTELTVNQIAKFDKAYNKANNIESSNLEKEMKGLKFT